MNGGDSDYNLSDDGDRKPKGVSGKTASKSLNGMNIGNGNQTKRNLFKMQKVVLIQTVIVPYQVEAAVAKKQ
jgi:hypothetical protein